jgi:hypothetical protein
VNFVAVQVKTDDGFDGDLYDQWKGTDFPSSHLSKFF